MATSFNGSGSAVSVLSAVTLANLADKVQVTLDDAAEATWSQAEIEGWILEGIKELNNHLPRVITAAISCSADERKYDLPSDFLSMLSVEYPTAEDPPKYLLRRPYTHRQFWGIAGFYDVIARGNNEDADEVWLSEKPEAGQTITILYEGEHDFGLTSSEVLTVPEQYHNILINFAVWKAVLFLKAKEEASPTGEYSLIMNLLGTNAIAAEQSYVLSLERAVDAAADDGGSMALQWDMRPKPDYGGANYIY